MNEFPLQPFLDVWARRGSDDQFGATPTDYERLNALLSVSGNWTQTRFREALMSLLARSPQQQDEFEHCFNDFFKSNEKYCGLEVDVNRALVDLHSLANVDDESPASVQTVGNPALNEFPTSLPEIEPQRSWTRVVLPLLILFVTACMALSVWVLWILLQNPDLPALATAPLIVPLPVTTRIEQGLQVVGDALQQLPGDINYWDIFKLGPLLWISAFFAYRTCRFRRKQPAAPLTTITPNWNETKAQHFRAGKIGGSPAPFFSDSQLDEIATSIGYCQENTERRLRFDATASVNATIKHRLRTVVFHPGQRLLRLYVLEDRLSAASEWHTAARELVTRLTARGLTVTHLYFQGVPDKIQTTDGEKVEWRDLENDRDSHALLFFSDCQALEPSDLPLLRRQLEWPKSAWLELREPRAWDAGTARVISAGLQVYPATADGIMRAIEGFDDGRLTQPRAPISRNAVRQISRPVTQTEVEYWLGSSYRWAQACAMIQPITHGLADALRRKFLPLLPPECWERLLLLPDTYVSADGVKFSDETLAVLRSAFAKRWRQDEQEEILKFILEQVQQAEPAETDSLAYLCWRWTFERIRLELEPTEAISTLLELERTPLGPTIRADLENIVWPDASTEQKDPIARPVIPLRLRPEKPEMQRQFARIAALIEAPDLEIRPSHLKFPPVSYGTRRRQWLTIRNLGDVLQGQVTADVPWLSFRPSEFTIGRADSGVPAPSPSASAHWPHGVLRNILFSRSIQQRVAVWLDTEQLEVGKHSGEVRVSISSDVFVVPAEVHIGRSLSESMDYIRTQALVYLPREVVSSMILAGVCTLVLLQFALPRNFFNRLYNRQPQLNDLVAEVRWNGSQTQPLVSRVEAINLTAIAADPEGDQLTFEWQLDKHYISTHDAEVSVKPDQDIFHVRLNLRDSNGGSASFQRQFTLLVQPGPGSDKKPDINTVTPDQSSNSPGAIREITLPAGVILKLAYIPPGRFMMGSPDSEVERYLDEGPRHDVTISYGFFMSVTEVTQQQWQAVMGHNPSYFQDCPTCPVERVSQTDAKAFIKQLNTLQVGYVFRLPSESEWEYAARATTDTVFAFGNSLSSRQANFNGDYPYGGAPFADNKAKTVPVGSYQPNLWGLHDMHGNVAEWCEDFYTDSFKGAPTDGSANVRVGDSNSRVLRGGSWLNYGGSLRSADRNFVPVPSSQNFNIGVRLIAMAASNTH